MELESAASQASLVEQQDDLESARDQLVSETASISLNRSSDETKVSSDETKVSSVETKLSSAKELSAAESHITAMESIISAATMNSDEFYRLYGDMSGIEMFTDAAGIYFFDQDGNKIYRKKFYTDELGTYYINENGEKIYRIGSNDSEYMLVDGVLIKINKGSEGSFTESATTIERQRRDDQEYIRTELGRPLRLALAAITVHQPADPINYLANYLLQYRYNQMTHEEKQAELNELFAERDRIRQEYETIQNNKKAKNSTHRDCNICNDVSARNDAVNNALDDTIKDAVDDNNVTLIDE